ncbi:MAG: class I SAM-dependent methyltransferase [Pseudomonadota bacterium]
MASDRENLLKVESHFQFGDNWSNFADGLDEAAVARAMDDLLRLLPRERLAGARLLDIGSGSGLSAVAALRLGCASVRAVDLDPQSVATSRRVLQRFVPDGAWQADRVSVFDLDPAADGRFDIVHSWGVLHHTGAMWRALDQASRLVRPGGTLAVALYAKTPVCGFWRWEKRLYTKAPEWVRSVIRGVFKAAYLAALLAQGRSPATYVREYRTKRGMNWSHDVHDWLGGYPYESATPAEVESFFATRGFRLEDSHVRQAPAAGLFGSPCNEFRFRSGS